MCPKINFRAQRSHLRTLLALGGSAADDQPHAITTVCSDTGTTLLGPQHVTLLYKRAGICDAHSYKPNSLWKHGDRQRPDQSSPSSENTSNRQCPKQQAEKYKKTLYIYVGVGNSQRTGVQFPAPTERSSQPFVTPALGNGNDCGMCVGCVIVCTRAHTHTQVNATACMWKSEDKVKGSVLSCCVGLGMKLGFLPRRQV